MSKSNAWESALLLLLFNNVDATNIGDAGGLRGSVAAGNLWISLHTDDPGEAGTQATNEATYTGYARVSVPRGPLNWTVVLNAVRNAAEIAFPACTGGTNLIKFFGVGVAGSGATTLLYSGPVSPQISVVNGIVPKIPPLGGVITED